uniref:Serine/threonine/tyrosine-interacting protein B n=1 Tax=Cacopsylla melanoneura TaxID=428564 RepID=A0A8D8ZVC2_9HEMI
MMWAMNMNHDNSSLVQTLLRQTHFEPEWTYNMRREMQEIVPNVFLGPYLVASRPKRDYLQSQGITHVICVRQNIEANFIRPNFQEDFVYLILDIADSLNENIIHHFGTVFEFIEHCLRSGGRVLIHGNQGISRSATLVIAYVMQKYNLSTKDALFLVQSKRLCVGPNLMFLNQLNEFEPIYKAKQQQQGFNQQEHNMEQHRGQKRELEIDQD